MPTTERQAGFTLLEVLVALAVLAIALGAIIAGGARYADAAGRLRDKTLALWVAHNRLTQIEMQPIFPDLGKSDGDERMGGQKWTWKVEVTTTPDKQVRKVEIRVIRKHGKGVDADLSAFITSLGRQNPS